jgi:hypothetical protein
MEDYTPPAGIENPVKAKGKKKDPNEPKWGQSSFMVFSDVIRSKARATEAHEYLQSLSNEIPNVFLTRASIKIVPTSPFPSKTTTKADCW